MITNRRVSAIAAGVGIVVASLAIGGTAWGWGASTGAPARTVSTTEDPPTSSRTKQITFDSEAQLRLLVDLPDPLPPATEATGCLHPKGHDGTWPLFSGSTVTVPVQNVILCPTLSDGSWGVSWYGDNNRVGLQAVRGNATFLLNADGTVRPGMLANVTVGEHRYRYLPASDDVTGDQFLLTDSFYGDLVSTTLSATAGPAVAPTAVATTAPVGGTGAAPAVPVGGSPSFTG